MYQPGVYQPQQTQSSNTFLYVVGAILVIIVVFMIYVTFFYEGEDPLHPADSEEHQKEIDEIGWFAYNRAQHEAKLNSSNYDQDNGEMININDIMSMSKLLKDLWDYADRKSFNSQNRETKRRKRDEFKNTLLSLKNSCEPYGKTYDQFTACVQSYVSQLNELGLAFDTDYFRDVGGVKLNQLINFTNSNPGNGTKPGNGTNPGNGCPESGYDPNSDEVRYLGWLAYNRSQHECNLRLNTSEDDQDNENMLDTDDIVSIANLFKVLWNYAVKESFKGKSKKEKRQRREEFKDTLVLLRRSCEPYGKTYNQFKACVQSYVSKLNELGPSFDGDWKQTASKWTYENDSDSIGDINLDYLVRL
jgi:RNA polymerase-interacting CarD/CdnL/TRCF family regulator